MGVSLRGFFVSRLIQLIVTMFIISVVVFFILRLSGDPILVVAPDFFSEEQINQMRKFWGFDRPLGEQYLTFARQSRHRRLRQFLPRQTPGNGTRL